MVDGKSPEWLPPGFTEKVKHKNGRKIKYYCNVATGAKYHSKTDVMRCATTENVLHGTTQITNGDDNGLSPNSKVDAIIVKTNDSPEWLPNGWIMEDKPRQSGPREGSIYKVYTELSSGSRFYSKAAVTRYLNTSNHANTTAVQNKLDSMDEPFPDMSLKCTSMTNADRTPIKKMEGNSFKEVATESTSADGLPPGGIKEIKTSKSGDKIRKDPLDSVDEPFSDMSPQCTSMTNAGRIPKKKTGGNSFKEVSTESESADGLPPGWIKEIKTSKSGSKIRKDPYYTDPVSGYVFRSLLDVKRYLRTNDIRSCLTRPRRRELDDLRLIKNDISSSNPDNEKLSENVQTKRQLYLAEELNGGESFGTKTLSESEAKISKQTQDDNKSSNAKVTSAASESLEEKSLCENPSKQAQMENNHKLASAGSEENPRVMAEDVAICSPITNPSTKQKLPESGMKNQTDKTQMGSRKSKKRKDLSLPSRTSKRLARGEPEMLSNSVLDERALRASARRSSGGEVDTSPSISMKASASIPLPSDTEPAKEAEEHAFISNKTLQEIKLLNKFEKPDTENQAIPDEQTGGKATEKQIDDDNKKSQESQFYEFGDSWSDPLEFAIKTLTGEISIDDTLAFPFEEQLSVPYNQADGCSRPLQSDFPIVFQNEVRPHSETSKQNGPVDQLPANPSPFSVPALGNISFPNYSGFTSQSSTQAGNKDCQTKFNP